MNLFSPNIRHFWEGKWKANFIEPKRRLYDTELVYVSSGTFRLAIGSAVHQMRAKSLALIPPNTWHDSRTAANESVMRHCIHFDWTPEPSRQSRPLFAMAADPYDAAIINAIPSAVSRRLPLVFDTSSVKGLSKLIAQMLSGVRANDTVGMSLLWPILNILLTHGVDVRSPDGLGGKTTKAVLAVRDYIDQNYAEPQGYADYCEVSRLSSSHLCKAFTRIIGQSPTAYLKSLRLHHARRLLQETSMNISEVADTVGIGDRNYFSRVFRRTFGMSPSQFLAGLHRDDSGRKVRDLSE